MQRRYCACGRQVMVDYRVGEWVARTTFWDPKPRTSFKIQIGRCPRCGAALNIDELN